MYGCPRAVVQREMRMEISSQKRGGGHDSFFWQMLWFLSLNRSGAVVSGLVDVFSALPFLRVEKFETYET